MILPDPEQFTFKDCIIGGDECILIVPDSIKCKWTEDTLKFRSMIIRKSDHKVISRSFGKFFNWFEQPDLDKFPNGPFSVIEKKDGSLIIWGIHNNQLIHRTRGTATLEKMDNGHELGFLMAKYPKLIAAIRLNPQYSILTEWETLTNVIILREVTEPTLTLVGVISNETGKLVTQKELDNLAIAWELPRPTQYHYNTILECVSDVEMWTGKEGVVLYSEDGNSLRKIKSEWYCELHKLVSGMKTVENVLDVFLSSPLFTQYSSFYRYFEAVTDHEIAERCKDFILEITVAYSKVVDKLQRVQGVVENVRHGFSRKEQAQDFQLHYSDWRLSVAFAYLDNREIDTKTLKKAILLEIQNKN